MKKIKLILVLSLIFNIVLIGTFVLQVSTESEEINPAEKIVEDFPLEFTHGDDFRTKLLLMYVKGNNLFGVKASRGWTGDVFESTTKEHLPHSFKNKKGYKFIRKVNATHSEFEVIANFRKYDSFEESILDYIHVLQNHDKLCNLIWNQDYESCLKIIETSGYATSKTYTATLRSIIRSQGYKGVDILAINLI
jgi:cupin superfamily acireductone dioxygenase involved in methionine salvage